MKLTRDGLLRGGRRMWLKLGLCLMVFVLEGVANAQAVSTTTVQGTVYLANGQAGSGTLVVSWPSFTTANGLAVAADSTTVTIAPDGFVSVNLTPNVGATPAGLYYTAVYYLSDGTTNTQYWVVPAAAQASLAQVQAQLMPATQAVQAVSKAYVDQQVAELTGSLLTASGGTLSGPLYLNGDPATPLQAADKHYVDTTFAMAVPIAGGNMTGPLSAPSVNGVQSPVAASSQTTLQAAINAAGTSGAVEIPPAYAGTDAFTNPTGIYVSDLRTKGAQQIERSVKEFGAVCDGTTDDTNALQAAINYAQTHGVALTIPQGTCKTRSLNWHGESIGGLGKQVSALKGFPGQDVLATLTDSMNLLSYTRIHDLTIYVDQSLDVSCSAAEGRAAAGSCGVNRFLERNSIFSPGGSGLTGTVGTGAGWAVGNCAIAMPADLGTGSNGLRVAEIENLEIVATGVDPMAAQYPGAHSTHTCGLYFAQWPQWSEFRNIDIRGLNTGIAIPALPVATPAGLYADSNRWQNVTIQATHAFTAAAGSNNVLDNVVAMAGNSAAAGETPTGLVLDLSGTQQGWTVRNAVVLPVWNAVQPQLTVTAAGGAVTAVSLGPEHGLGFDPYGAQVPLTFSGSCTAQATASVNNDGSIGTVAVTSGGVGCSGTTTASVNAAGTWDTAAPVNLIGGQNMTFFDGNLLKGNGGYTVWNAAQSESYGTQLDGGGGRLPSGGSYAALVAKNPVGAAYAVDQFPGADFGAKLQACLGAMSASYGGTCDARNFTGTLSMGSNLTISTSNATVLLPCATISTANRVIVTAGTRNVSLRGCALRGASAASGNLGGTVFQYSGAGAMVQVGDPTYAGNTSGFHMDNAVINTTATSSATAQGLVAYRTQEMDLESLYFLGNQNQTGMTLDGTGNYTGGTFFDDQFDGFQTAVNAIGHQIPNAATTDWMNASTFVRLHIDCPESSGSPIAGTYGINLQQGDGNTFTGGDVEGCSTALHLGANAQNNTILGLRNEVSTNQVVADAGSAYNNWMTGGTMFTGALTDNGTRNSFLDTFHRSFNGLNGDWYGSQKDATVTNHYRIGIGAGNERGLLDRYQTDYGYRWTMGLSDATAGEQFYQILDELNGIYRLSIGQYNNGQSSTNNQTVINSAGTGAIVLNGSTNAGTGGITFGSGGASETTVATISNAGNALFNGTLQVGGVSTFTGSTMVKNQVNAEIDQFLWAGLTASQKESFTYKDWNGNSQWYMVKDQNNNWALNSATGGLDSFKAYQSTNSGDTYINASNPSGVVRVNYETGSGAAFNIYGGGSGALYASFTGTNAIKFPGLAASSGLDCLQVDNSGYISNTGSACGTGSGTGGSGTVSSGTAGQIARYPGSGTVVSGSPATVDGSGNLSTPATVSAANLPITVTSPPYNAVADNTTDNTAAFQAAINAASYTGQDVYVPSAPAGHCYNFKKLYWYHDAVLNPGYNPSGGWSFKFRGGRTSRDNDGNNSGVSTATTCLTSTDNTGPAINFGGGPAFAGNTGTLNITNSSITNGTATFNWTLAGGTLPVVGQIVQISGTTNDGGQLNLQGGVIASVTGTTSGTFTVTGIQPADTAASQAETGTAKTGAYNYLFEAASISGFTLNVNNSTWALDADLFTGWSDISDITINQSGLGGGLRVEDVWEHVNLKGLYILSSYGKTYAAAHGGSYPTGTVGMKLCNNIASGLVQVDKTLSGYFDHGYELGSNGSVTNCAALMDSFAGDSMDGSGNNTGFLIGRGPQGSLDHPYTESVNSAGINLGSYNQGPWKITNGTFANPSSSLQASIYVNQLTSPSGYNLSGIDIENNAILFANTYGIKLIDPAGTSQGKVAYNTVDGGGNLTAYGIGLPSNNVAWFLENNSFALASSSNNYQNQAGANLSYDGSTLTAAHIVSEQGAIVLSANPAGITLPSNVTGTQGTDANLLSAGTVSGTAQLLCTDANGGATTLGCTTGSGAPSVYFNVLSYGAKADKLPMAGTYVWASLAAGSSTLYVGSGSFTSADAGKYVTFAPASTWAQPFSTGPSTAQIVSVTDGQHLVLSRTAAVTEGAYISWGTDNVPAFNACATAVTAAGGGTCAVPAGNYLFATSPYYFVSGMAQDDGGYQNPAGGSGAAIACTLAGGSLSGCTVMSSPSTYVKNTILTLNFPMQGSANSGCPTVYAGPCGQEFATVTTNSSGQVQNPVTIVYPGFGLTSAPVPTVNATGGDGATATTTLAGGTAATPTITNGGSGYPASASGVLEMWALGGGCTSNFGGGSSGLPVMVGKGSASTNASGAVTSAAWTNAPTGCSTAPTIVFGDFTCWNPGSSSFTAQCTNMAPLIPAAIPVQVMLVPGVNWFGPAGASQEGSNLYGTWDGATVDTVSPGTMLAQPAMFGGQIQNTDIGGLKLGGGFIGIFDPYNLNRAKIHDLEFDTGIGMLTWAYDLGSEVDNIWSGGYAPIVNGGAWQHRSDFPLGQGGFFDVASVANSVTEPAGYNTVAAAIDNYFAEEFWRPEFSASSADFFETCAFPQTANQRQTSHSLSIPQGANSMCYKGLTGMGMVNLTRDGRAAGGHPITGITGKYLYRPIYYGSLGPSIVSGLSCEDCNQVTSDPYRAAPTQEGAIEFEAGDGAQINGVGWSGSQIVQPLYDLSGAAYSGTAGAPQDVAWQNISATTEVNAQAPQNLNVQVNQAFPAGLTVTSNSGSGNGQITFVNGYNTQVGSIRQSVVWNSLSIFGGAVDDMDFAPGGVTANVPLSLPSIAPSSGNACLQINSAGVVSNTGSACGGSGGGVTSFAAPSGSWPSWLVPTVTNSTSTPSLAVAASATGTGNVVLSSGPTFTGNATTFANSAAAEQDVVIQPGAGADQIGAFGWNNYAGTSQWKLRKDASNYLRLTDMVNSLDREVFYQNGQTVLNAGAGANPVVVNGATGSGTGGLLVESGGSSPAAVLTVTGSGNTTATGFVSGKFMMGSGTMSLGTGAAAGTSPSIVCLSGHVCDGVSGTVTLTTGTSPTTGTLATLSFPNTHSNSANCIVDVLQSGVGRVTTATWTESTTAVTLTANTALTASTAYTVKYWCGGN